VTGLLPLWTIQARVLTLTDSDDIMGGVRDSHKPAIRVGVNAHLLSCGESYRSAGISWYIQNLLHRLPDVDPEVGYTVFLGERSYKGRDELQLWPSRLPTHRPEVRIFWEQVLQPWAIRQAGVDLLHGMALVGPMVGACPVVITVHDLSFLFYPRSFPASKRLYLRAFTGMSVRRARRVIAISENTKRDVVQQYGISPDRVDRIYYGIDPIFRPLPAGQVAEFRSQRGLPERFVLFVGTLEPRKNVVRLIEAYAQLRDNCPPLLLVGGKGWLYDEIFARVGELDLTDKVRFVGYVAGKELPWWYNAADLFVYPSLYEGFGLPPLEAMACGAPVITSSVSSLPEVVGEAGLLVDPDDVQALAEAMERVLADSHLREAMRAAGLAQAGRFSWQEAARRTVETYHHALMPGGGEQHV
jgi:glycosyltransferase involved in cell wall biosynthesis